MDPTTLVTFLFKAPPEARTIELLGSWDNFGQPYRMHHDRRRGAGFWSGCFKFENIIFDGDKPNWNRPRTGGLKQGGTYWYYYRLDNEIEAYDDSREYTTACPLLPGQTVNVIDIPTEMVEPPARSRSASADIVVTLATLSPTHTLEPGDKFAALEPPPISKVHARCRSEIALNGRPESSEEAAYGTDDAPQVETNAAPLMDPLVSHPRYHGSTGFNDDDRSSVYSRQSWSSGVSSFAHSSIVDVYEVDSFPDQEHIIPSISLPDVPAMPSRPPPGVPIERMAQLDLQPSGHPDAKEDPGDAFEHFDFGLATRISQHNTEQFDPKPTQTAKTELPASSHTPNQDPPPSVFRRDREFLHLDLSTLHKAAAATADLTTEPPQASPLGSPDRIRETAIEYTPRHLSDDPVTDDDIWSPTFSAATVSSRGGVNTPYRVSLGQLRTGGGEALETVAEHLRALGTSDDGLVGPTFASFAGYTLLESHDAGLDKFPGSVGSLKSAAAGLLPTVMECDGASQTTSFAESIFSELNYLSASIG